jgi:hypothetical protein
MSRYRKLDPRFWKDEKIIDLPPLEKLIVLYMFTGQSNRIGLFNFSPGSAVEDLGISTETFREGFAKVCGSLNFGWDAKRRVVYLPTWWKYNCPENPNVLKSCLADLHEIPQTGLITEFSRNLMYLPETFHQTFREGLAKPSPQRMPHQEQEQEQEQKEKAAESATPPSDSGGSESNNGLAPAKDLYQLEFEAQIKPAYPKRDGDQRWQQACEHYRAARKEGESLDVILAGIIRYAQWLEYKGLVRSDKVKQAASFLGKEKCWREPWEIPAERADHGNEGFVG